MKNAFLAVSALILTAGVTFGAPPTAPKAPAKPVAKKPAPAFPTACPVTGEAIASAKNAAGGSSVYKGKTYYFCCAGCKPTFDKNPAKFAKAEKVPMTHGDVHKGM